MKTWIKRKSTSKRVTGRLPCIPPKAGDVFYLRILLSHIPGPKSFDDLKLDPDSSFKEACIDHGFLIDDKE